MRNSRNQLDLSFLALAQSESRLGASGRGKRAKQRPRQMSLFERYAQEKLPGLDR